MDQRKTYVSNTLPGQRRKKKLRQGEMKRNKHSSKISKTYKSKNNLIIN